MDHRRRAEIYSHQHVPPEHWTGDRHHREYRNRRGTRLSGIRAHERHRGAGSAEVVRDDDAPCCMERVGTTVWARPSKTDARCWYPFLECRAPARPCVSSVGSAWITYRYPYRIQLRFRLRRSPNLRPITNHHPTICEWPRVAYWSGLIQTRLQIPAALGILGYLWWRTGRVGVAPRIRSKLDDEWANKVK
jgi:hypothetical protein